MKYSQRILSLITIVAVVALVFSKALIHLLTESWWFESVGFATVFWTRIQWTIWTGLIAFVIYAALIGGNYAIATRATRHRPIRLRLEHDRWSNSIDQIPAYGAIALICSIALLAGISSAAHWETVLKFFHGSEFGITDPIYQNDVGFYLFRLPFYHLLQGRLVTLGIWSFLLTAVVYFLKGEITFERGWRSVVNGFAKVHLGLLLGAIAILIAAGFILQRYELLYSPEGVIFGAGYTDVHARLQSYWFMAFTTLGLMLVFLLSLWRNGIALPIFGIGLYIAILIVVNGLYPAFQQQFIVEPNELEKERPYIEHNIAFTRAAYQLDSVQRQDYEVTNQLDRNALNENQATISNIRLWDYRPLLSTYRQLQEIRLYYRFLDVDVDRYTLNGDYQQVMLAPRELDYSQLPAEAQRWVNQRLQYTHGYGIVMSPVDRVTSDGLPEFFIQNIPPESNVDLEVEVPGVYYGEKTDQYIFTGTTTDEFDYPRSDENAQTRYDGAGGVPIGSWGRKLAYAYDLSSFKVLISNYLTPETKIHYHRQVRDRIQHVAPFLIYDHDPYITLVDGRLKWIVDAYTVSNRYPYSQPISQSKGAAALLEGTSASAIVNGDENYIRNSVKVVVDAYDGTMQFVAVDATDPVLTTYQNIFPDLFVPASEISPDIQAHFRYPVDLFKVQSQIYLSYHMDNPEEFYNQEDLWRFPEETYDDQRVIMQPYYLIMRLPDEDREEFILIMPFTPVNKDNMVAWMAARSDGDEYGNLLLYEFPKQELIYGPSQIEARVNQNPEISQQLTLWDQEGSRVIRGDLLVIPIDQSLLYVEPVYLRAEQGELPELQRVIAAYGDRVVMEPTLDEALAAIFGATSAAGDRPSAPSPPPSTTSPTVSTSVVRSALEAYDRAQEALRQGDWESYGEYQQELGDLLNQLNQDSGEAPTSATE